MKVSSVKEGKGSFLCLFRCNNSLEREGNSKEILYQVLHLDFRRFYVSLLEEVGEKNLIPFCTLIKRVLHFYRRSLFYVYNILRYLFSYIVSLICKFNYISFYEF